MRSFVVVSHAHTMTVTIIPYLGSDPLNVLASAAEPFLSLVVVVSCSASVRPMIHYIHNTYRESQFTRNMDGHVSLHRAALYYYCMQVTAQHKQLTTTNIRNRPAGTIETKYIKYGGHQRRLQADIDGGNVIRPSRKACLLSCEEPSS